MIDAKKALTLADLILGKKRERGDADDERTAAILDRTVGERVRAKAQQIIRAGAKARGELVEPPRFSDDRAGRFAKAVVNAARKRDGKEPL